MSISDQIVRLTNAKAAIKQSIENKGVDVSDTALLDEYPALIDKIEGGGEGGNPYYEELFNMITNNNTDYSYLFYTSNKTSLDLSNLDSSNVTNMSNMFYSCGKLTSLDLSNFDTSSVTNMGYMFSNCSKLTSLDLSNFNTSNVTDMSNMFNNCYALSSLDLSSFDASKVTTSSGLKLFGLSDMSQLTDFKAPKNIKTQFDVSKCIKLTHDSLMSILNNLTTKTSTTKLTLGATNLAKLSDEEKAIATNKGWTLA